MKTEIRIDEHKRQRALLLAQAYVLMALDTIEGTRSVAGDLPPVDHNLVSMLEGISQAMGEELVPELEQNDFYDVLRNNKPPYTAESVVSNALARALPDEEEEEERYDEATYFSTVLAAIDEAKEEEEDFIQAMAETAMLTFTGDNPYDTPESIAEEIAYNEAAYAAAVEKCQQEGHVWAEESADGENGSSDMVCQRCGYSETVYFS